jgi:muramoyltetrapeptide carboxypeptidase
VTLLIDPPNSAGHGRLWSHLASDTSYDELHRFASALGIPRRGFDRDHYDIPAERYDEVVAAGAQPVSSRVIVARLSRAGLRRRKPGTLAPRRPGSPLLRARRLRAGDKVAVVAPAGPVPEQRLRPGIEVLESWGLQVAVGAHARGTHERFGYLSAADGHRAADLMDAWCDPEVTAVFCARGGYGVQRIVELLDWPALAEAGPSVLVGFSDVTALHQAFATRLGLSTIHGPVVSSLGAADAESRAHLRSLLFEPAEGTTLTPTPVATLAPGRADGVLAGGNIALLAAEAGTSTWRPAVGCIAVLEEIGEDAYRLDRLVTQLLRAGWFDGVRGIALGDFTDCVSPDAVRALVMDRLAPLNVPMVSGLPVGHERRNLAFPLGVPATLDADAGTLVLRRAPLL